jgi:hypothetical protein
MSKADEERARRLAEALRQNLRRRKAQAREADSAQPAVGDRDGNRDGDDHAD